MAGAVYQVDGVRQLRASLRRLGADMGDFADVHEKVAEYVGATAARRTPRQSGMLAASWRPGKAQTQATIRFGGAAVPYAHAIHWGVGPREGQRGPHNIAPSLFATSAAADTEQTWFPWYHAELERMVAKVRGA